VRTHPITTLAVTLLTALLLPRAASAHPHVWVTVKATVLYDNGTITGLRQEWTFDEMYTAMAIEGLDKNNDGRYDRQELSELAQVNIDGLKEFDYFTYAKLGKAGLKFSPPIDYWLDYTSKGILTLHLTLPLQAPVPSSSADFEFSVYDPSFFIAFDFAKDDPVKLGSNAPPGCAAAIVEPPEEPGDPSDSKRLNQAFSDALGQASALGFGGNRTAAVRCTKS
jgi:ABC-type uncharacterized transport system substrate-binding protein